MAKASPNVKLTAKGRQAWVLGLELKTSGSIPAIVVPVTADSIWQNAGALIASIVLVVVGLIVERICRIKDDGAEPLTGPVSNPAPKRQAIAEKKSR